MLRIFRRKSLFLIQGSGFGGQTAISKLSRDRCRIISLLKFTAFKYQILKDKHSITKQLFWTGLLIFGFVLILVFLNQKMPLVDNIQDLIMPFFLFGLIPFLGSYVYQYFDYERIESKKDGIIDFNEDEIIIDYSIHIKYHEITDLHFGVIAYHGERINMIYRNPNETKSLGIRNYIGFSTKFNAFKYNFKLESELHLKELENTIFELVKSEKLTNIEVKKLIILIPKRFKTTDGFKNFVTKQIVEKRIGCTEGLLLHGYSSDKEAAELRKKYCGK